LRAFILISTATFSKHWAVGIALSAIGVAAACQSETLRLQHAHFPTLSLPERRLEALRVATFNAGLAVDDRHAAERAPKW
jgi:hypothetical protein